MMVQSPRLRIIDLHTLRPFFCLHESLISLSALTALFLDQHLTHCVQVCHNGVYFHPPKASDLPLVGVDVFRTCRNEME